MGLRKAIQPEQEAEFIQRYNSNESTPSIAAVFNCCADTVTHTARRLGLQLRKAGPVNRSFSDEELKEILQRRDDGTSITRLAIDLSTCRDVIERVLTFYGREIPRYEKNAAGSKAHGWKGGKHKDHKGYILIWLSPDDPFFCMAQPRSGGGYVPEHRLVMARSLGRPLERHEQVHHINGIRDDNRLKNLQLRNGNHGSGVVLQCNDCGSHDIISVPIAEPPRHQSKRSHH